MTTAKRSWENISIPNHMQLKNIITIKADLCLKSGWKKGKAFPRLFHSKKLLSGQQPQIKIAPYQKLHNLQSKWHFCGGCHARRIMPGTLPSNSILAWTEPSQSTMIPIMVVNKIHIFNFWILWTWFAGWDISTTEQQEYKWTRIGQTKAMAGS